MQYHLKCYATPDEAQAALDNIQLDRSFLDEAYILTTVPEQGPTEYRIALHTREGRMLLVDEERMEADGIEGQERPASRIQ